MSNANVELVKGIYEAFSKGDVPGVLSKFDSGIVWNEADHFPYADGNPYVGPDAVLKGVFMRCVTEWDGFAVRIDEIVGAGEVVLAMGRYAGTYKATGRSQDTQMAHVWRIAGGKVVRFQQYADTLHVARVAGLA